MRTLGFVIKRVYKLAETTYTSIGLWSLKLMTSVMQPEMTKKTFTRQDNTLTGSSIIKVMIRRKDKGNNSN